MKKILLFSLLFALCAFFAKSQIIMDPATIDEGSLPTGMSVVDIDGTPYLQVVLNGWNSILDVNFVLATDQTISCDVKYAHGSTAHTLAQTINCGVNINDTINLVPASWDASQMVAAQTSVGINPADAGDITSLTKAVDARMGFIHQLQFFAQENASWGGTVGDTLWVGKVKIVTESPFVVMRPVELDTTELPDGMSVVNIGDAAYLQVITNGWNSILEVDGFELLSNLAASCEVKYAHGSTVHTLAQTINCGVNLNDTVNLVPASWDASQMVAAQTSIGINPADATDFTTLTKSVDDNMKLIHQIQIFAQENASWGGTTGDTLWVGDITLAPLGINELTVENDVDIQNVADSNDYSVTADISWDTTKLFLKINIIDDSIFNDGRANVWEVDNIEVYFDMNNAKADAFDDDDYQLRLMNDSTFTSLNSLGGVTMVYAIDSADGEPVGYSYDLTFIWDSLSINFNAAEGTQFGFDILASDNDGDPDYRDQISWNSISGDLWNTPYYWGTLELTSMGKFNIIEDDEDPTAPTVTAAVEGSSVKLTWTGAEDNTSIGSYIVSQDDAAIDTVTGTSITISDLAAGTYEFSVVAVDIYGNNSDEGTAEATVEGGDAVENITASNFSIYPNPATSELRISGVDVELVELFNVNGNLLKTYNKSILDISDIETGLYILKVYSSDNIYTQKLVKK